MKIEGFIADVTSVGSPARVKHDIWGKILVIFWPIHVAFVIGEPLCDLGNTS